MPQNLEVFISIYRIHGDCDLYRQPERFLPLGWETVSPSIYEYNRFSAGFRTCIGAAFTLLEIKILLALLYQRFRCSCLLEEKIDRVGAIVRTPKQGIQVGLFPQNRGFSAAPGIRGNMREEGVETPNLLSPSH